jgi:hypothetical protein
MEWTPPASSSVVLLSLHLQLAYPEEESTMKSTVIAVDLAKNVFEITGLGAGERCQRPRPGA